MHVAKAFAIGQLSESQNAKVFGARSVPLSSIREQEVDFAVVVFKSGTLGFQREALLARITT